MHLDFAEVPSDTRLNGGALRLSCISSTFWAHIKFGKFSFGTYCPAFWSFCRLAACLSAGPQFGYVRPLFHVSLATTFRLP